MRKQASDETSFHVAAVIPVGSPAHLLRARKGRIRFGDRFCFSDGAGVRERFGQ